jgi:DNA replication protein DnaC
MADQETKATKLCQHCGKGLTLIKFKAIGATGQEKSMAMPCECVGEKHQREERKRQDEKMMRLLFDRGFQSGKYAAMTLGNWQPRGSGADIMEAVTDYIRCVALKQANWLYLYGNYGVGKTHIAVALARQIALDRRWEPALFRWGEYCSLIQHSWHDKRVQIDWRLSRNARILVLDDIDKKTATRWALSQLYDIIDYRYIHNLPTVMTANRSLSELSQFWHKDSEDLCRAIISRVVGQLVKVVHFEGEDYRFCAG